ncbi:hypothetical protein BO78DRAFT_419221 [Aspergillus sclerotiicarbonarius CBS 121057]|uniref:DUF7587 domain-containing protein n=1 Tax=Aspergillus sclerotiicarbonarius (strain CBS 121057 / IBT 28362) TaxID=1448318 RepID=A0A319FG93_ASPSB|nr:hypothetical protein BO78DRAFT_419221 [Aspergillus sclerotiicarbonarius CBS 121057]
MASTSDSVPTVATQTLFRPNPFQKVHLRSFASNQIPTYLFRLVAPDTDGSTSTSAVTSRALMDSESNHPEDIFRLGQAEAAALVYEHLDWKCDDRCNFMSWTSSLLFALQYGLFRHRKVRSKPDLSEILLFILDTRGFPEGTFIKDLDIIDAFKKHSDELRSFSALRRRETRSNRQFYFGEYLTQGELNIQGKCATVSLQQMIDHGLFDLYPRLRNQDKWNLLAIRVLELREDFAQLPSTTPFEVRKAIEIAQGCFTNRWIVPFAAMLLSLKARDPNDAEIVARLSEINSPEELDLQKIQIDVYDLPEVRQFARIINSVHRESKDSDISLLLNPFTRLDIE